MVVSSEKVMLTALLLINFCRVFASSEAPQVKLPNGDFLTGSLCPETNIPRFRGIPFAQAPTGSLRFMPPRQLNNSLSPDGAVFDASHAASPCPQFKSTFNATNPSASENCLTVDVYMPADATQDSSLPVKVWAYGGFNQVGATSYPLYDACYLATDAIVVEFNYRVGALGFLSLGSAGIQGNMAIQDAIAALEWVQTNIGSFGGDKSQVLLFGQSAGADDTFVILTLPEAPNLISAAITESGGGQFLTPYDVAQKVGASYASVLNCSSDDLACLQSRSVSELVEAYQYQNIPIMNNETLIGQSLANQGTNIPKTYSMDNSVLDGKIIRDEPLKVGSKVPIIAGATQNDAALFILSIYETSNFPVTTSNYSSFLESWGPDVGPQIGRMYPLSRFNASGSTSTAVVEAITRVMTEGTFICPSLFVLKAAEAAGTDAYGYRFNHTPSCPWLWFPDFGATPNRQDASAFGPTHTSEIPFVFGDLDNMPYKNGSCNSTASEYAMSHQLTAAWTAMAKNGSPATPDLNWPKFNSCHTSGIDVQDKAYVTQLDFTRCEFWGKVFETLAGTELPYLSKRDACTSNVNGGSSTSSSSSSSIASSSSSSNPSSTVATSESIRMFSNSSRSLSTLLMLIILVFSLDLA